MLELRVLTQDDRESITALFRDVFSHEPWNDDWSDEGQLHAYLSDLTDQRCSLTLGFFDGSRLTAVSMGYIKHWFAGTEYLIDEFCVDRCTQGRGIGSAFMAEIEKYLADRGIFRIFLQTDRGMPACAFYIKNGFQELPDHLSFTKRFGGNV